MVPHSRPRCEGVNGPPGRCGPPAEGTEQALALGGVVVHGSVPVVPLVAPVASGATTGVALPKMRVTVLLPEFVIQIEPVWSTTILLGAL